VQDRGSACDAGPQAPARRAGTPREWVVAFWRLGVLHGLDIRPEGSGRESPVKPRLWQESHMRGVSAQVGARTLYALPHHECA
jgi:hypothetical protein